MPKISKKAPDNLKPYTFHGVDADWSGNDTNAVADCPWCGKEEKFAIKIETGVAHCWSCSEGSSKGGVNPVSFIRKLWELSFKSTTEEDYTELAEDRSLIHPSTLMRWQLAKSILTDDWLIPGFNAEGKMCQLYRHIKIRGKGRMLPTPTLGHQMFGINKFSKKRHSVFICEGPWDAMALWEVLNHIKEEDEEFKYSKRTKGTIGQTTTNVIAIPGTTTFHPSWCKLFSGKNVFVAFDNDHPKKNSKTGKEVEPATVGGMRRVVSKLSSRKKPPSNILVYKWGSRWYNPELPDGRDFRDVFNEVGPADGHPEKSMKARTGLVPVLLEGFKEPPHEWSSGDSGDDGEEPDIECLPCDSYRKLIQAWQTALSWTPGLDCALSVMLSSIVSTESAGDQLWVKIIGPASCGKSTLCEAISVNQRRVIAKSTIRGFHSGYKSSGGEGEDNSLVSKLAGRTLATKDGDTLLQSPNLGQILSEARDLYDRTSRTHYRNKMSRDYSGINMTWILCGTSSLRSIDSSELGERFLDCVIMDRIDDDLEAEIALSKADRTFDNMTRTDDGSIESQYEPELLYAMQLTGGYIDHLCDTFRKRMGRIKKDKKALARCSRLGKFVALMRARPSQRQDENAEREFSPRLVGQLVRLATCLTVVLDSERMDDEVMRRVSKVALDTSRGQTLEITHQLYDAGREGIEVTALSHMVHRPSTHVRAITRFMRQIGALESFRKKVKGVMRKPKLRLTPMMHDLYESVMDQVNE